VLADQRVVFARQLIKQFRFKNNGEPRPNFRFNKTSVLDDIGVIEMYEDAIRNDVALDQRIGNWVHEYQNEEQAIHCISNQLGNVERIREYLRRKGEASNGR